MKIIPIGNIVGGFVMFKRPLGLGGINLAQGIDALIRGMLDMLPLRMNISTSNFNHQKQPGDYRKDFKKSGGHIQHSEFYRFMDSKSIWNAG